MMDIALSAPGDPADLNAFLRGAFQFRHKPRLIRLGFSLAKASGIDAFVAAVPDKREWDRARKEWLVSTQFGLTEPDALHSLLEMPISHVRLHGWRPASASLRHGMFGAGSFHAKIIAAGPSDTSRVTALLVGSANLTGSALGAVPMNYEAALTMLGRDISIPLLQSLNHWWKRAWNESLALTHPLVDEYARTRAIVLKQNPDLLRFAKASARKGAEFGSMLWIEAGAMSGGPRHQIEFAEELVPFFGPLERQRRLLRIRHGGQIWADRPLSYKVTTFGVEIWRLSLPTQMASGLDYVGRVVRWRRSTDAQGLIFDLAVCDADSAEFLRWRRDSEVNGHVGVTGGGREYGLA